MGKLVLESNRKTLDVLYPLYVKKNYDIIKYCFYCFKILMLSFLTAVCLFFFVFFLILFYF